MTVSSIREAINNICDSIARNTYDIGCYPCFKCFEQTEIKEEMELWYNKQPLQEFTVQQLDILAEYHSLLHMSNPSVKQILMFKSEVHLGELLKQCSRARSDYSRNIAKVVIDILTSRYFFFILYL